MNFKTLRFPIPERALRIAWRGRVENEVESWIREQAEWVSENGWRWGQGLGTTWKQGATDTSSLVSLIALAKHWLVL